LRAKVWAKVSSNEAAKAPLMKPPEIVAISETLAKTVLIVFIKLSRLILMSLSSCA
jgi:hypothetical protein